MELGLAGMTALVTGASRGIGLAVTKTLVTEGVRVVGVARRPTPELVNSGALVLTGDLSRPETAAVVVEQAVAETGSLDLLVNNAGGGDDLSLAGFADLDDDAWTGALDLNLMAAVRLTRAALPELVRRGGVVVNVSSVGARKPDGPPLAYNVAKAALTAFGRGLAFELGPQGVRVVTVTPGPTRTAMWDQLAEVTGAPVEAVLAGVPQQLGMVTGRMNEPAEVAALIAFLLSPRAANVTGSDHLVDGGAVRSG